MKPKTPKGKRPVQAGQEDVARLAAETKRDLLLAYSDIFYLGEGAKSASSLLDALVLCLEDEIPIPKWVADEFPRAYKRWSNMECRTLDEAFRVQRPKGAHLSAARRRNELGPFVARDVYLLAKAGAAIDVALFDAVGKLHAVGRAFVAECHRYYGSLYGNPRLRGSEHMRLADIYDSNRMAQLRKLLPDVNVLKSGNSQKNRNYKVK